MFIKLICVYGRDAYDIKTKQHRDYLDRHI